MDFALTDIQQQIRDTARQFARTKLLPRYQSQEKERRFDRGLLRELGELGLLCTPIPEQYGGGGQSYLTHGLIVEEIAWGDHNMAYNTLNCTLISDILVRNAPQEVIREWVPRISTGELICGLVLTEPDTGSDAAKIKLRARKDGGDWVLNGEKTSISMGSQSDLHVVFARSNPDEPGAKGISAFLVPGDSKGLSATDFNDLGARSVGRGSLFFDDVRIPGRYLIGDEGKGFSQVMVGFDMNRVYIGLMCLAPAQASVEETWKYVQERKAFGSPIVRFEGVSFPLAEAETLLEAARQLCYKALWLRDQDKPHTAEAAMCKWWAPVVAFDVIKDCLLLHGHAGYSDDFPHQQRLRDVLGLQIGDGTAQIMKLIIAREKVGRIAMPY